MTPADGLLTVRRAALAAALAALVVSLPTLANGFVYDDVHIIAERPLVQAPPGLGALLTAPYWPQEQGSNVWRPGALTAFAAEWAIGGGRPVVFHAVNVALYAALAGLLALLAGRWFGPVTALATGLLFAAHPVHVEAVANVVGQAELVPALCYVAVLLLAWRRDPATDGGPRIGALAGIAVLTALGMSFKEHMVTLPGALVLLWWLEASRSGVPLTTVARREVGTLVAVLVPVAGYLALRASVTGHVTASGGIAPGLDPHDPLQRLAVMLPVSLEWLRLLFWPLRLSADYGPAEVVPRAAVGLPHAVALAVWGLAGWAAWRVRRHLPAVAVGAGLFVVTVSVVSNVVVPLEILLAERLLLLPSAGWALAVGGLVAWATAGGAIGMRRAVWGAVAVVTVLLAARSVVRAGVWQENDAFFSHMERDAPDSYVHPRRHGIAALARGDTAAGEALLREAVERNPWHAATFEQLGLVYVQRARHQAAVQAFARALEQDPERTNALFGLAVSLTKLHRGEEALPWLDRLDAQVGPSPASTVARIEALRTAGRFDAAVALAEATLAARPDDWYLHLMAAEAAVLGGRCEDALRHVEEGIPKTPERRRRDLERVRSFVAKGEADCK